MVQGSEASKDIRANEAEEPWHSPADESDGAIYLLGKVGQLWLKILTQRFRMA